MNVGDVAGVATKITIQHGLCRVVWKGITESYFGIYMYPKISTCSNKLFFSMIVNFTKDSESFSQFNLASGFNVTFGKPDKMLSQSSSVI